MARAKRANGEGCIFKLENGKYRMRLQYGNLANGNPRILTVTADTKRECISLMSEKKQLYSQGSIEGAEIRKNTLAALCEMHFNNDVEKKDYLKAKSADRRETTINKQIKPYRIGRLQVSAVDGNDIEKHIEELINEGLSVSSIKKAYDVINSAYKWGIAKKYITDNPCTEIAAEIRHRLKKLDEKHSNDIDVVALSDEDIAKVRKADKTEIGLYTILLLETGMRVGELCALRWSDYHPQSKSLAIDRTRFSAKNRKINKYEAAENIVKNAHAREIALSQNASETLDKLYVLNGNNEYVALNRYSQATTPTAMIKALNKHYRIIKLDKDVTGAHVLRRTFATLKHNDGVHTADIAAYMGDEEATVVKHYIAIRKKIKRGNETINIVPLPRKMKSI